jgi:5'-nucleotidase
MEAAIDDINSIGFSLLDFSFEADFGPAKHYARILIKDVLDNGIPECKLLNVNIPAVPLDKIKGIKSCRQSEGNWTESFIESEDPRGQKYYWMTGDFLKEENATDTDMWALDNHYVSVVPSMHDLTKHSAVSQLKHLEEKS